METVTSLVGNKIFASLYDPNADKAAADFRSLSTSSLSSLTDTLTKGAQTKDILSKIPGVSEDTKSSLDALLNEAKTFTGSATGSSPNTINAKKDEVDAKIQDLVKKAQTEAKDTKDAKAVAKKEDLKERVANQTFSPGRLLSRTWNKFKYYFFYIGLAILALIGGSMSSNAMFETPVYMRIYYFIYGTVLFPLSFIFAFMRYSTGQKGVYHAILAPLVEGPLTNPIMAGLLYPFTYTAATTLVAPLPVFEQVPAAAVPEAAILQTIQKNAAQVPVGLIGSSV
jgi:hypothetical protein